MGTGREFRQPDYYGWAYRGYGPVTIVPCGSRKSGTAVSCCLPVGHGGERHAGHDGDTVILWAKKADET